MTAGPIIGPCRFLIKFSDAGLAHETRNSNLVALTQGHGLGNQFGPPAVSPPRPLRVSAFSGLSKIIARGNTADKLIGQKVRHQSRVPDQRIEGRAKPVATPGFGAFGRDCILQ